MDREGTLQQYLHAQIPLSAAMRVSVVSATAETVILSAPLEPNINHKDTAFGGSLSTLGILAAWSLLHLRLVEEKLPCEVVIQSNQMDYDKPVTGPFTATSSLAESAAWPAFRKILTRRKLARIEVQSLLMAEGIAVGRFSGRFVAFLRDDA
jgi:thioesterase domain-containing protein